MNETEKVLVREAMPYAALIAGVGLAVLYLDYKLDVGREAKEAGEAALEAGKEIGEKVWENTVGAVWKKEEEFNEWVYGITEGVENWYQEEVNEVKERWQTPIEKYKEVDDWVRNLDFGINDKLTGVGHWVTEQASESVSWVREHTWW